MGGGIDETEHRILYFCLRENNNLGCFFLYISVIIASYVKSQVLILKDS